MTTAHRFKLADIHPFSDPENLPFDELTEMAGVLRMAHLATCYDRKERGIEFGKFKCHACDQRPTDVRFFDFDSGSTPTNQWRLAARMSCGTQDDAHGIGGYFAAIAFALRGEKLWADEWADHLEQKTWYDPSFRSDLLTVDRMLVAWRAVQPKAFRAPKVYRSDNPRAISPSTRQYVMERDCFRCCRCGAGPSERRLEIDHVVPVAKGGTAELANLQTLCDLCNAGKSHRDPHEHDLAGRGKRRG